ncbi:GAF domain-containing protein [Adhaeribacter radiodurans]|uniref:GAF domain-containing protein n=1 Tax=Adhaeribacter radiodurans TaxID=2745197 RepID=A0A7L7LC40_9BACT|nr:GAF domain-containing protein [Adhaeribacter radiodurans]QMU30412.1 GAF domain-containing protein [Adhaeribacter radiodurans]
MKNTFGIPIIPCNDRERVKKLHEYNILDTHSEGSFKHITSLAAHIFKVPIALISFVDSERVWFKANEGMEEVTEIDRGISLCSLSILNDDLTVFTDTLEEPCLLANPLVAGSFGLRFYAAAPLQTADGYNLGSVCIVDKEPRKFTYADQDMLTHLAELVMKELELWKENHKVCNYEIKNRNRFSFE